MEKRGEVKPDETPDLEETPADQKQAAARSKKTREELDNQDPQKRGAEAVKGRLKEK